MKIILAVFILIAFGIKGTAQANDEQEIRKLLEKQSAAWNKGSLDEFMQGYWNNDSMVFIGKKGPAYGYSNTLLNYKKSYPDASAMGKLKFELVQLNPLSDDYYFVIGKWALQRTAGNLEGFFSLLLRKINNSWVIIADHSS